MERKNKNLRGILAYCSGDIYGGGAFVVVGTLFLRFLTDSALIGAGIAGTMLLIGKIWDAIIDPVIGNMTDHSRSKFGRRRVFFLAGIFHIGAAFLALWAPIGGPLALRVVYYVVAYLLFATSFSFTMVPYHAYLADISRSYEERNKTIGIRAVFSNLSSLVSGVLPLMLIGMFGWFGMGAIFGLFYTIPWIIVFIGTRRFPKEDPELLPQREKTSLFKQVGANLRSVSRNRSYRILLGIYIFAYSTIDIFMAINIYYLVDYLQLTGKFLGLEYPALVTGIFILCQVAAIVVYVKISNRFGKKVAFIIGASIWITGFIVILFAQPGVSQYFIFTAAALMGVGGAGCAFIPWGMLPEASDVEQLISHQKKEGSYSGVMTFVRQLAQALALFMVGVFLDLVQYRGELAVQEEVTRLGIKYFYSFAPILLLLVAVFFALKYPVTRETYKIMQEEIDRIKAHDTQPRDETTKAAYKALTGKDYPQ